MAVDNEQNDNINNMPPQTSYGRVIRKQERLIYYQYVPIHIEKLGIGS